MNEKDQFSFLLQLIRCSYPLSFWKFDEKGTLLDTDCPQADAFSGLLVRSGALAFALSEGSTDPVCLGSMFSTVWGGAFALTENGRILYLLGPAAAGKISEEALEDAAKRLIDTIEYRKTFMEMFRNLPTVSLPILQHCILMLHCTLRGEKISEGRIRYQKTDAGSPGTVSDCSAADLYPTEQRLLHCMREGDAGDLSLIQELLAVPSVQMQNPINSAILSAATFTSLCERAAIEGGLPPETAFTVGETYRQAMAAAPGMADLQVLSRNMFQDLASRVHSAALSSMTYSEPVRECMDYINLHPEEDFSLESLAAKYSYASYYFSRKFHRETGQALSDYITGVRIKRAQYLLTSTDLSVADIAARLHFCSSTHFSGAFRKAAGMLPGQYRRSRPSSLKKS